MKLEIVYALPNTQGSYFSTDVPEGMNVQQVLEHVEFFKLFPDVNWHKNKIGVFGKIVSPEHVLTQGDRIEIYRPIYTDPKVARMNAVKAKRAK